MEEPEDHDASSRMWTVDWSYKVLYELWTWTQARKDESTIYLVLLKGQVTRVALAPVKTRMYLVHYYLKNIL